MGWPLFRLLFFLYVVSGGFVLFFGDRLLFSPPEPPSYSSNAELAADGGEVVPLVSGQEWVRREDEEGDEVFVQQDVEITALYLPRAGAELTVLYSHGSREDLGQIRDRLRDLRDLSFNVLAYDYRGYGTSQGRPSEIGAYRDINAAYRYLTGQLDNQRGVAPGDLLVYGRGLGSGPATDLAARQPVGGLILESAFTSAIEVLLPINPFPFSAFDNRYKISQVRSPVLLLHGTGDRVVPCEHSLRLYGAANIPKRYEPVVGAGHDDLLEVAGADYDRAILDFAILTRQYVGTAGDPPAATGRERAPALTAAR